MVAPSKQEQRRGRSREKRPTAAKGSEKQCLVESSESSGRECSSSYSPPRDGKGRKKRSPVDVKGLEINIPDPPATPPSTMATILSSELSISDGSSEESSAKENRANSSYHERVRQSSPKSSQVTPKASGKATTRSYTHISVVSDNKDSSRSSAKERETALCRARGKMTPTSSNHASVTSDTKDSSRSSAKDRETSLSMTSAKERSLYRKALKKERMIRDVLMKAADDEDEILENQKAVVEEKRQEGGLKIDTNNDNPYEKATQGENMAPKKSKNDSSKPGQSGCIIRIPTPVKVGPSGAVIRVHSPKTRTSPGLGSSTVYESSPKTKGSHGPNASAIASPSPKSKNSMKPKIFFSEQVNTPGPKLVSPSAHSSTGSGLFGWNISHSSRTESARKCFSESQKATILGESYVRKSPSACSSSGQIGSHHWRPTMKAVAMRSLAWTRDDSEPSVISHSSKESTPSKIHGASDAESRASANSSSHHLRQDSSETHFTNNLTPRPPTHNSDPFATKKEGILRNRFFDNKPPHGDQSSPGSGLRMCSESHRELQLGRDMVILSEAFHLDKNTQSLLAEYDARTVEDFSLMTTEDLDHLVEKAADSNRPLPPLQIRKVQVLREWAQNLADQRLRGTELSDLCQCSVVANEVPTTQPKTLIPQDWAKQFREDLPRLKQTLKERGERTAMAAAWFTSFCLPIPLHWGM